MQAKRTFKSKSKKPLLPKRKMGDLIAARLPEPEARIAHKEAIQRGADCPRCPLFGLRSGPVMGEIVRHAKLAVIGQEPGGNEVEQKRPFIGESGRVLEECLANGGMARDEATITNAVLCRPPEDFDAFQARLKFEHKARVMDARKVWEAERVVWTEKKRQGLIDKSERYPKFVPPEAPPTPQQCCAPRLKRDLDESASPVVMPLGGIALEAVANYYNVPFGAARKTLPGEARLNSLKKQAGSPSTMPNGHIVLASYHPAFGTRKGSRHYMQVIVKHIARGAMIARRGGYDWKEPDYIINPRIDTIRDVLSRYRETSARVAVDIETDRGSRADGKFDPFTCRIRCIGFAAVVNGEELAICVPLRRINGEEWWSTREEKIAVLGLLVEFFADTRIRLMGHNFAFDSSVLLRFKIMQNRHVLYDDSMLMMHDTTACDLPKDLGFTAAFYFEVPAWKGAADDKYYTEVTDQDLHLYNLRDALITLRLYDVLITDVYKCGTIDQYDMDKRLAPVARDMGELGLFTDEEKRGELSITLGAEAWARFVKLQDITKDPAFNPNTPKRIRDFLFGTKGLKPEFNAKGMQIEEGEDPSTNANALLAIQTKQKIDQETHEFINNIFEYRAYTKLLGTYVNNLPVHYPDWQRQGYDVGYVEPVMGRVFSKWGKEERVAHYNATGEWKEGEWREDVVIRGRPKIGRLFTTYKIHVIPSGRMSSQPACFDAQTEILTRRGWLCFSMLKPDDEVAQYHWEDKTIEFVKPTAHITYRYEGEMVRIEGTHLDVLCTPDHKFWFRTRAGRKTVEVEAKDWPLSVDMKVPVAGALRASGQPSSRLSDAELRFLLAAQADGYVNSGGYWEFSFTEDRKVKALTSALAELGYAHTVAPKQNGRYNQTCFVVKDLRATWVDSYLVREGVEKTFVATRMLSLPVGNLVFIADEIMLWDGCATRKNHYSSSNKANADLIQAIHVLVGRAAKVRRYENERLTKPNWQVDVRAQDEALNYTQQSRVPYNGTVYCVSVPSSMIVVRRNNKPIIAGNCQNWPERGKANMREMITSPPGHVIVGADLDQVELRLYAVIAQDKLLLKAFNTPGMDPHAYNAASLFARVWKMNVDAAYEFILSMPSRKRAEAERKLAAQSLAYQVEGYKSADDMLASYEKKGEQEKKKHRNIAKTFVYLELYGGEAEKLFMFMSMARDKATGELMFPDLREEMVHEWHDQWHKHHPETKSWQETCGNVARVEGYTAAPFGSYRKRFFPGGANKPAATFNHVIQSEVSTAMILTDQGYQTIEDLIEAGGESTVYVRENQWAKARVIPEGEAPIWRVRTSNGRETEWSKAHRVRKVSDTGYEWTHVCDLKPGDLIAKQPARALEYGDAYATEDAYWAGYALGNGSYSNRTFVFTIGNRWHVPLHTQVECCTAWASSHGYAVEVQWRRKDAKHTTSIQSEECAKDEATHAVFRILRGTQLVRDLGLTQGDNCYEKRVPARIWAANLEARKAFLRGFLQADGYIKPLSSRNPAPIINLCNKELIYDLQLFCDLIGIEAVISGPYKADKQGHSAWRLTLPQDQVHRSLGLGRPALERGGELAPAFEARRFLTPKLRVPTSRTGVEWSRYVLQSRIRKGGSVGLAQLEQMGVEPLYGITRVVSVEDTGRIEPVYTLSVDHEDHSYVCESIVSKNSSAAEVANRAILEIAQRIPYGSWSPFTGLCLQVHDYIGVYCPEERAEEAKKIIEEAMCCKVFGIDITASAKISKTWAKQ